MNNLKISNNKFLSLYSFSTVVANEEVFNEGDISLNFKPCNAVTLDSGCSVKISLGANTTTPRYGAFILTTTEMKTLGEFLIQQALSIESFFKPK